MVEAAAREQPLGAVLAHLDHRVGEVRGHRRGVAVDHHVELPDEVLAADESRQHLGQPRNDLGEAAPYPARGRVVDLGVWGEDRVVPIPLAGVDRPGVGGDQIGDLHTVRQPSPVRHGASSRPTEAQDGAPDPATDRPVLMSGTPAHGDPGRGEHGAMALDAHGVPGDLPASSRAYAGFQGRIGRTMAGSEPWWPPRPQAGEHAPTVVVVLVGDLGYSDVGCFGSEIATPHIDRLAEEGVRYTDFHATPLCSPTRAALLTGRNSHTTSVGYVAHADPGFPGHAMELADDVSTIAEVLGDNGYAARGGGGGRRGK